MAKASVKSPLNDTHYTTLKTLKKSIKGTSEYLAKCKKCQIDIDDEIKHTNDQAAIVDALLREFFPERPLE